MKTIKQLEKKVDDLNLINGIILTFLFALIMGVFFNPHFTQIEVPKTDLVEIYGYHEFSGDNDINVRSYEFSCDSMSIKATNNFNKLCSEPDQFACAGRPLIELRGYGYCIVHYTQYKSQLTWGYED